MTTLLLSSILLLIITALGVAAMIGIIGFVRFVKDMFEIDEYYEIL